MSPDEFGYPIPGKYEYILDLQKLLELLRTKAEIARQTAESDWQQQANLAGVDSTVFLRDRELVLYDLTTKAATTGQHCTAFKTLSSELTGMSVEAWKRIKEQEAALQRQKWDFTLSTLQTEEKRWLITANTMLLQGDQRWQASDRDFLDAWYGWRNLAKEKIEDGTEEWNRIQGNLASAQAAWITKYNDAARTASADAIRAFLNDNVDDVVTGMLKSLPGGSVIERFDIEKLKNDMLKDADTNPFSDAFMSLSQRANTAFTISEITAAQGSAMSDQATKLFDEFSAAAQMMQNMQLFETLNKLARSYESMLVKAEDSARETIRVEMEKSGFANSGGNWTRRAIYDANLWETKWKTQVVPGWQTFRYEPFTVDLVVDDGVPFDKSMLATVPQSELDALVTAARMGLKNKWRYIYEDAKDPRSFTYWQGTPPSTEDEDGSGQYGIIFTAKVAADKEKAEGEAKANAPFFKKGLIPGMDFSLFDFAKIGLSIAGGGPWLSFALDAVDTMSQVVSGDMSLGDGLLNVAKGAAGVGIGAAASWAGSVAGDTVKSIGLGAVGSVAASVSSAVVQNYVNCYANSAIQALDFNHGFKFDKDKFKEGTKNIHGSALSAALTTAASSSVMAAFGADWNNGKMGFTDATGRDLSFMGAYGKTAQPRRSFGHPALRRDVPSVDLNLAGMASGLSGQLVSAAMGNGFSMNVLSSDDLGLGGNRTGLLSLTLGGDNSGFKFGSSAGWDISMSAIGNFVGSMDYLTTEMKTDKVAQFFLANNDSKEGMARLTYVNYGNLSGNTVATNIAQQIINGDKKLEFGISASDAGHYGHAGVANNTIQLNEKALEISRDNLGAVGGFTAMMAREGFLIDANKGLGTAEWSDEKMRETGAGAILTMAAFNVQKGAMDDIAKNLNIKYDGEWAGIKDKVDYVAKSGDLSGFDATGRDFLLLRDEECIRHNIALTKNIFDLEACNTRAFLNMNDPLNMVRFMPELPVDPNDLFFGKLKIWSGFEQRNDPFTGGSQWHPGIDIGAEGMNLDGIEFKAIQNGVVHQVGQVDPSNQLAGYGNMVVLQFEDGGETYYALYAHAKNKIELNVGSKVAKGQALGMIGSTGYSQNPHLHFEIYKRKFESGFQIDPVKFFRDRLKLSNGLRDGRK